MRTRVAILFAGLLFAGVTCAPLAGTAGPPIFKRVAAPTLGELGTEHVPYVVPSGEHCGGKAYTALRIWYRAGPGTGTDTFSYTIEFPHEATNPRPSKCPQPVTVTVTIE